MYMMLSKECKQKASEKIPQNNGQHDPAHDLGRIHFFFGFVPQPSRFHHDLGICLALWAGRCLSFDILQPQTAALAVLGVELPMKKGTRVIRLIEPVLADSHTLFDPAPIRAVKRTAFGAKGIILPVIGPAALITTYLAHGNSPLYLDSITVTAR